MVAQFYPPIRGGIERHVQTLATALAARGHRVAVATLWHKGLQEFEFEQGVSIYRVRGTLPRFARLFTVERQHSPPFPDPEVTLALRRIITIEQPEIVHAHNWMVHSFLPLKAWSRARLVMTLHDCEVACAQMRFMFRDNELCCGPRFARCWDCTVHHYGSLRGPGILLGNQVMSRFERAAVDMFLPVSCAIADANRLAGSRAPFQVVPNFVPDKVAEVKDNADQRLSQLPAEGFILQVGDLVPDKGVQVLMDAYAGLPSAPPLVLIGRRDARSPASLPAHVVVLQDWPHDLVMHAWQRSLFGTVASTCLDASPTVTLEAMSSGRSVIGSRIGGIADQIEDGETGLLVPPGDVPALRNAMARLIENPALRTRLGEAARQKAIQFQSSTVVSRIEGIYSALSRQSQL